MKTATTTNTLTAFQIQCVDQGCAWLGLSAEGTMAFERELLLASDQERELLICAVSPPYFLNSYIYIYDPQALDWIPFALWAEQTEALILFHLNQLTIALKARQLGLTWLALGYALWQMMFRPIATVLIFSKRDDEAIYLLSEERLKGMYARLPQWMQTKNALIDSKHQWKLRNGSMAYAFPTTAGDSYTASLAIMDEADLMPDLNRLMRSVKPTIDAGGKLVMISRSNKSNPNSEFKRIYRAAKAGANGWAHIFLPWWVRPSRDAAWYEAQKRDILANTGGLDALHEQYPASDTEALAPASLDKRIPPEWVENCFAFQQALPDEALPQNAPRIPGLRVFRPPERFGQYAGGVDCAEGLPTSDDSAATWVDNATGEEVCNLVGKLTPQVQAAYCAQVSTWYNDAALMIERNNHGHATIGWLQDNGHERLILAGHDNRPGWNSTTLGKVLMYDEAAETFRTGDTRLHDIETQAQLGSIETGTLRAPEGELDDRADSYALALVGRRAAIQAGQGIGFRQGKAKW